MSGRPSSRGFSLIETLLAFTILALVAAALFRGMAEGTAGLGLSQARYEAAAFAQSQLDRLIAEHSPQNMPNSGTYRETWVWTLETRRVQPQVPTRYEALIQLWDLELAIADTNGRELATLNTTIYEPR